MRRLQPAQPARGPRPRHERTLPDTIPKPPPNNGASDASNRTHAAPQGLPENRPALQQTGRGARDAVPPPASRAAAAAGSKAAASMTFRCGVLSGASRRHPAHDIAAAGAPTSWYMARYATRRGARATKSATFDGPRSVRRPFFGGIPGPADGVSADAETGFSGCNLFIQPA